MADCITYETYLRQQVDRGCYGVAVIQAVIALDIADYIEKRRQPTIEPERNKGKWIPQKGGGYRCSACNRYALDAVDGNFMHVSFRSGFCPHCGCDMGVKNERS